MNKLGLFDYLKSINETKQDIMRKSDYPEAAEKQYSPYITNKMIAKHPDTILLCNELNKFGLKEHYIDNLMHYEFLLHIIPKRKRFTKFAKQKNPEIIELIMKSNQVSEIKALEMYDVLSADQIKYLETTLTKGGKE